MPLLAANRRAVARDQPPVVEPPAGQAVGDPQRLDGAGEGDHREVGDQQEQDRSRSAAGGRASVAHGLVRAARELRQLAGSRRCHPITTSSPTAAASSRPRRMADPRCPRRLGARGRRGTARTRSDRSGHGRHGPVPRKAGMQRYSIFSLARNALTGHRNWQAAWRSPEPKPAYDVVIVGAGGHGLATAYYLAKEHGITNVAVLEQRLARRRQYRPQHHDHAAPTISTTRAPRIYEHALKLWEGLSQELNYNVMFSPRGVMMLAHNVHDVQVAQRHIHANRLNGIDNEWLTPAQAKAFCPPLNLDRPALPGARRHPAAARRHRPPRRGRLGLRARRRRARRRHHPELRGHRHPPRGRPGRRRRDRQGLHRAPGRSAWSPPGTPAWSWRMAGLRMPLESTVAAGAGLRAGQAGASRAS